MCRNIRVLHNFEPPTTGDEIHASALQFVRKVSGIQKPSKADQEAFERAVEEVVASTTKLLAALPTKPPARTREGEIGKARARWARREAARRA